MYLEWEEQLSVIQNFIFIHSKQMAMNIKDIKWLLFFKTSKFEEFLKVCAH